MNKNCGLNKFAKELFAREGILLYTEEVVKIHPDGRRDPQELREIRLAIEKEALSEWDFDDGEDSNYFDYFAKSHLHDYIFSDGMKCQERVQIVKSESKGWFSSDTFWFLALKNQDGTWIQESLWTEQEMAAVIKEQKQLTNTF